MDWSDCAFALRFDIVRAADRSAEPKTRAWGMVSPSVDFVRRPYAVTHPSHPDGTNLAITDFCVVGENGSQ